MTAIADQPIEPFTLARMDIHVFRADVLKPVVTSFATMASRATVLLRLEDTDGAFGWGEIWGNFPTVTSEHRANLAAWALPSLVVDARVEDPLAYMQGVQGALKTVEVQSDEPGPIAGIAAGLDQALWDLIARRAGVPLRKLLNGGAPDPVPAYASGLNPADAVDVVAASRENGFRRFKLKIGFGADVDHANIRAIKDGMGAAEILYTDANMRWSPAEALENVPPLAEFGLGWVEEPMRADQPAEAWRALKAEMAMPLAGGENLRGDAAFAEALEWLDFVQPDVGKLGGVSGCLAIVLDAIAAGRTYCPHWLSGGAGVLEMDVNENPLRDAVLGTAISLADGDALLPDGPGIGIDVDTGAMEKWRVSHQSFAA